MSIVSPLLTDKSEKIEPEEIPFVEKSEKQKRLGRGTATERAADEIAMALHEKTVVLFSMLHGFLPVTSVYATQNSDKAVTALVNIGKRNPKILAYLSKAANGVDALEIGKFVIGILVCVQVDSGRAKGDEFIARSLGVTEILEEHFWENQGYDVNDSVLMQQVPHFAGV